MVKIGLFGNIANNFFRLGQILSSEKDLEVTLFLPAVGDSTNFPEGDQPADRTTHWDWIDRGEQNQLRHAFALGSTNLIRRLSSQDIVFVSSINVMIAPFIRGAKVVFCPTGADMNVFPFFKIHLKFYRNSHGPLKAYSPHNLVRLFLIAAGTRRGIKSCDFILENPFPPYKYAVKSLKLPNSKLLEFPPPLAIDTNIFRSVPVELVKLPKDILRKFEEFDFRIFSASRILINKDPTYVRIGQYKQNDLLVRAFAQFLKTRPVKRCGLFFVDRGRIAASETAKMKKLIEVLGIEENVVWLDPPHNHTFDRATLVDMYSISDVVADDFGVGWFGSASLEALSCGRPLLNYVDPSILDKFYPWQPFLSSNDQNEISEIIRNLHENPIEALEIGARGRQWVQEFHSSKPIKKRYSAIISRIVEG